MDACLRFHANGITRRRGRRTSAIGWRHFRFDSDSQVSGTGIPEECHCFDAADGLHQAQNKLLPLLRIALRKYPEVIHALEVRHDMYNQTTAYVRLLEQQGDVCVIRPDAPLNIKQVVHDPAELKRVYDLGRKAGEAKLKDVQAFLA